jgi:hypothetical protein
MMVVGLVLVAAPACALAETLKLEPYPQMMGRQWTERDGLPAGSVTGIWTGSAGRVTCAVGKKWFALEENKWTATGPGQRSTPRPVTLPAALRETTPWEDVTAVIYTKGRPASFWVGTTRGLCFREGDTWRALSGLRWLPNNHVTALHADEDGSIWVGTQGGVAKIHWVTMTLEEKARQLNAMLQERHVRHGLVTDIVLNAPDDFKNYRQPSNDNDGLWTALYVGAESFRYAVTMDPSAKANARRSLEALMFLETVTGMPGFCARSFIEAGRGPEHGGEWHRSADGKWDWKGDTSSDELCGHMFAYEIYHRLVADEAEKKEIAGYVGRIMGRIVDDGYIWKDVDGKATRWGVWSPEKLNHDLRWIVERGLNSLQILSFLRIAHKITGDDKFDRAINELVNRHAYPTNTLRQKHVWPPNHINHSDDELAFLPYYGLLIRETDEELRRFYLYSIERSWQIERPERSPFLNYIYGGATGRPCDAAQAAATLREMPMDMRAWAVVNSDRRDFEYADYLTRFRKKQAKTVFAWYERRLMRWNGNPYQLDEGGDGTHEYEPSHYLLPYWMGRYHKLIEE